MQRLVTSLLFYEHSDAATRMYKPAQQKSAEMNRYAHA